MSKRKLDIDKIAKGLRARRKGTVFPTGGYPGAAQLAAEVQARFRVPPGGGRPTDPGWSDKRLVPIAPRTLKRLERIAKRLQKATGTRVEPMQLAALLVESASENIGPEDVAKLVTARAPSKQM